MPTSLLVALAMIAFAANSVLCRMALGDGTIDAASFTTLRLLSGAVFLACLLSWKNRTALKAFHFDTIGSTTLFIYAVCFSFAYLQLTTGTGALILFGTVQLSMVLVGIARGERPILKAWIGMFGAFAGLVYLVLPGVSAPPLQGALLMAISGLAWGMYSLHGKGAKNPIADTAYNFIGTVPLVLVCSLVFLPDLHLSTEGILLGITSGAAASALGYVLWYAVLPTLTASTAATVQLSVPVIASIAGVIVLGEELALRLIISSLVILGSIALIISAKSR